MELEKEKNKDSMKMAWANIESKFRKIKLGGGKSRLEKIKSQGKVTINKGKAKSFIVVIIFLSRTKERVNIVLNLATSEG